MTPFSNRRSSCTCHERARGISSGPSRRFVSVCAESGRKPLASKSVTMRDCIDGNAAAASITLSENTPTPPLSVVRASIFHVAPIRGANTPPSATLARSYRTPASTVSALAAVHVSCAKSAASTPCAASAVPPGKSIRRAIVPSDRSCSTRLLSSVPSYVMRPMLPPALITWCESPPPNWCVNSSFTSAREACRSCRLK